MGHSSYRSVHLHLPKKKEKEKEATWREFKFCFYPSRPVGNFPVFLKDPDFYFWHVYPRSKCKFIFIIFSSLSLFTLPVWLDWMIGMKYIKEVRDSHLHRHIENHRVRHRWVADEARPPRRTDPAQRHLWLLRPVAVLRQHPLGHRRSATAKWTSSSSNNNNNSSRTTVTTQSPRLWIVEETDRDVRVATFDW